MHLQTICACCHLFWDESIFGQNISVLLIWDFMHYKCTTLLFLCWHWRPSGTNVAGLYFSVRFHGRHCLWQHPSDMIHSAQYYRQVSVVVSLQMISKFIKLLLIKFIWAQEAQKCETLKGDINAWKAYLTFTLKLLVGIEHLFYLLRQGKSVQILVYLSVTCCQCLRDCGFLLEIQLPISGWRHCPLSIEVLEVLKNPPEPWFQLLIFCINLIHHFDCIVETCKL